MNRPIGTMASLLALILMQGCTGKDDTSTSQEHTKGDMITQEEALIVTTLNEVANAESQFFSTKDSESILRFYAQDYMGIKDGKSETVKDHKKYLAEILEQIRLGKPIGISSKLMNIKPSVEGRFGWATYEYEYKVAGAEGRARCFKKFHKVNVLPSSESKQIHGSYDTNIVRRHVRHFSNLEMIRGLPNRVVATRHQRSLTGSHISSKLINTLQSTRHSVSPIAHI